MTSLLLDLRHAARLLAKNLGATAMAVLTLALAIGATTAIFSVVYGVLLRPLPYPAPDRLMAVWEVNHRGTYSRLADPNFDDFRDRNRTFAAMAKYTDYITPVLGGAEPFRANVATVTRDFFTVLGVAPATGRGLTPEDARIGAEPIAVVSHRYWVQALGSAPAPLGQVRIEGRSYTVVGVMPADFRFPDKTDVWRPAELERENASRTSHNYYAIGRLRDGVSAAQANADISAIARDVVRQSPEQGDYLMTDAAAVPLSASLTRRVGSALYVLLGAVSFLLVVACANVTNLLLAQAVARQRELSIRHALGAGRARLVRQFVVETFLLLTMSCAGGLVIAFAGTNGLLALAPADLPRLEDVEMSRGVLVFAIALSALVAVALGVVTAMRASRRDPRDALVDGARGQAGGAWSRRMGSLVVGGQMAITVVLLVGAALLGRSLLRVLSVDPGFRTDGIVAMDLAMPESDDPAGKARLSPFYSDLFARLRAIPGVEDVAAANAVPLDGGLPDGLFLLVTPSDVPRTMADLAPRFQQKARLGTADYCAVTPAYFRTLGIPLRRGRVFDDRDTQSAPHVAVVSESLARQRWPGADPIGATIEFGNMDGDLRPLTVVGVVGDTREYGLERPPRPTMYVDLIQRPRYTTTVVMRTSGDPRAIVPASRQALKEAAPDVPPRFRTFAEIYRASLGERHFNLTVVACFAVTALVLAVAGIYGVMSYSVIARRKEIGVRMALGATPGRVFRMVLGQGMLTTGTGVAVGVVTALVLTRTLETLLFGVTGTDPLTFAAVIALLVSVAAVACYFPARRATAADPMAALGQD
jgi:putative ABC transport system permease protein